MRLTANPDIVLASAPVSLAANYTGPPLNIAQSYLVGIQYTVANAAGLTGTLNLLGRIGTNQPLTQIPSQTAAISANGSGFFFVPTNYFSQLAVQWVFTGGTGSLSYAVMRKESGS